MIRMLRPRAATSPVAITSPIASVSPSKIGIAKNLDWWSIANMVVPMSKIPAEMVKNMEMRRAATIRMPRDVIAHLITFPSIVILVSRPVQIALALALVSR